MHFQHRWEFFHQLFSQSWEQREVDVPMTLSLNRAA
jgi:hypothetical protein